MLVSTKGRYALRVLIVLAERGKHFTPLKDIAALEEISEKYLESILVLLTKVGILEGLRGKGGGYRLSAPPTEITVGKILKVVEGSLAPVAWLANPIRGCGNEDDCKTRPMWIKLDKMIETFFEGITLQDLVNGIDL